MAQRTVRDEVGDLDQIDITDSVILEVPARTAGNGAGGDVYKATYAEKGTQKTMAVVVKVLVGEIDNQKPVDRLNREIANWKRLKHENILQFLGIARALPSRPPGLVSPYIDVTNILRFIAERTKPGQGVERRLARGVCSGLQHMHQQNVVHGDIKADNVLLDYHGVPKITDFGVGEILDIKGYTTITQMNTRFAPPERLVQIDGQTASRPKKEGDIWSLGMLFLQFFNRESECLPFKHIKRGAEYQIPKSIQNGDRPRRPDYYALIPDQHWSLMEDCWKHAPADRPTIDAVLPRV